MSYVYCGIGLIAVAISVGLYRGNTGPLIASYTENNVSGIHRSEVVEALSALETIIEKTAVFEDQYVSINVSAYTNMGLKLEQLPSHYFDVSEDDWAHSLYILKRSFPDTTGDTIFALIDCYRRYRKEVSKKRLGLEYAMASHTEFYKQLFRMRALYFGPEWAQRLFEFEHGMAIQNSDEFGEWLKRQAMSAKQPVCQLYVQYE